MRNQGLQIDRAAAAAAAREMLENQDVILAVVSLVALLLARVVLPPSPAHPVRRTTHPLAGRHVRLDGLASVSALDGRRVVLVVRSEAERTVTARNRGQHRRRASPRVRAVQRLLRDQGTEESAPPTVEYVRVVAGIAQRSKEGHEHVLLWKGHDLLQTMAQKFQWGC